MRDIDRGDAGHLLQAGDLGAHLAAQAGIEIGERLVHEIGLGRAHQRPAHGDALALAAGELARLAAEIVAELQQLRRLAHLAVDLRLVGAAHLEAEADILGDRQVRVERIGLEHHRDVALARREIVGEVAVDPKFAVGDFLEPRDHAQRRRLAAARRPDKHQELAIGDGEVERIHGDLAVVVTLGDAVEYDLGHRVPALRQFTKCHRSGQAVKDLAC